MFSPLNRRTFLRSAGAALALPLLDVMGQATAPPRPRRMVALCTTLGIYPENLYPARAGRDWERTPYLDPLWDLRNDLTLVSGSSHPEVDGGHSSEASYLTAAPHPGSSSFRNTISLDQFALERLAPDTRFGSLTLSTSSATSLSFSRSGAMLPAEDRPSRLFTKLFVNGTPAEIELQIERLREGQSILDGVLPQSRQMQAKMSLRDRQRLDEYLAAVRDVEQRLLRAQAWARRPKPTVTMRPPTDVVNHADVIARTRLMYDLMHLALQTDSTRLITLKINGHNSVPPIDGVTQDWHNLSHHGRDPEKVSQLRIIERDQFRAFTEFLVKVKQTEEAGNNLLDRTMILYGSNLGNSSSHDTRNMPILLAGGGFRHGQHLAFDQAHNTPLCRLFVSMLQRLEVPVDEFASGRGRLQGLELA